jgi:hypothetical protein
MYLERSLTPRLSLQGSCLCGRVEAAQEQADKYK